MIKKILFVSVFVICNACTSENQHSSEDPVIEDEYKKLSRTIEDYSFEKLNTHARHVSYLPGFNNMNIDHWRALLNYGHQIAFLCYELGKESGSPRSCDVIFINTDKLEKQTSYMSMVDFTEHNQKIVIGIYQVYPDGSAIFTADPFQSQGQRYYSLLEESRKFINAQHYNALEGGL